MKIFKDENQLIYKYFTKKKKTYLQVRWDEFGGSQSDSTNQIRDL